MSQLEKLGITRSYFTKQIQNVMCTTIFLGHHYVIQILQ